MKKAVVILLAIMLVCGLCACAQPEANPGQGTAPGTEGTEPGMDEPGGVRKRLSRQARATRMTRKTTRKTANARRRV